MGFAVITAFSLAKAIPIPLQEDIPLLSKQQNRKFTCSYRSNDEIFANSLKFWPLPLIQDILRAATMFLILAHLPLKLWFVLFPQLLTSSLFSLMKGCLTGICITIPGVTPAWNNVTIRNSYKFICGLFWISIWWFVLYPILLCIKITFIILVIPSFAYSYLYFRPCGPTANPLYNNGAAYTLSILKYVLNNDNSTEIKKRIIASSYYLTSMLSQQYEYRKSHCQEVINLIANKHNDNVDNALYQQISWKALRRIHFGSGERESCVWVFSLLLSLLLYNFLVIVGLMIVHYHDIPSGLVIIGLIYFGIEIIGLMVELKILRLLYYCHHLSPPIWGLRHLKIDEVFEHPESMMDGIS